MELLSKVYPFQLIKERRRVMQHADGSEVLGKFDSVRTDAVQRARYKPGNVVQAVHQPDGKTEHFLQVPTLLDFADENFQKNHCFMLRGIDEESGEPQIRVDFPAAAKIKSPDVAGSVFLHPTTFRLVRSEIRLTRIPGDLQGLTGVSASTFFQDVVPGLPTIAEVVATSKYTGPKSTPAPFPTAVERQSTLLVQFTEKRPESLAPPKRDIVRDSLKLQP